MKEISKGLPTGPLEAMKVFNEVKTSVDEYVKIIQIEKTGRAEIRAKAKVAVAHINAQTEVLLEYLQLAHDSRADFFERAFASLDSALDAGDTGTVTQVLATITEVAKRSPFADLKDVGDVGRLWEDPDAEIEV